MNFPVTPILLIIVALLTASTPLLGQRGIITIHSDFLYTSSANELIQDVYYISDTSFNASLQLRCLKMTQSGDSVLLYSLSKNYPFKKGTQKLELNLSKTGKCFFHQEFKNVIKKTQYYPAGEYVLCINISLKDTVYTFTSRKIVDSTIAVSSSLRKGLNDCFMPGRKGVLGVSAVELPKKQKDKINEKASKLRLKRFLNKHQITAQSKNTGSKEVLSLYSKSWFLGYYEIDTGKRFISKINNERKQLDQNIPGLTKLSVENTQSLFSQIKDIKRDKKENNEIIGEIGITGTMSTGQEELSETENNYYELRGDIEIPVMDIPFTFQGYYTSQDRNRMVKSSYLKMHYDNEKAKQKLQKLIGGYKNKYNETKGIASGTEGAYTAFIGQLSTQKEKLLGEIKSETGGVDVSGQPMNEGLKQQMKERILKGLDSADKNNSANNVAVAKDSAERVYRSVESKYQKIKELEKKAEKYKGLLTQYSNTVMFDSVLVYEKVKDLSGNSDELSYKQLAKKASGIVPDNKIKAFATGLTTMDVGIFSKEVSNYTMSGQTMKGIDVGYDIGVCEVGFTFGKAEYINRLGYADKYTTYAGRVSKAINKNHKASLFYYGYTPDRKMLQESFYDNMDISLPGFKENVHIISGRYDLTTKHNINASAEVATSFRKQNELSSDKVKLNDRLAYNVDVNAMVPKTTIKLDAGYQHVGLNFENNSLPVSYSGSNLYRAGAEGLFVRTLLTLGLEFNYLEQQSLYYKGGNMKWGVNVKYSPKRYPSVSFSYKPFSTFRSYNDTLNIPQRPMFGETMTGRIAYNLKRKTFAVRFNTIYTQNRSQLDTLQYSSRLLQTNCSLIKPKYTLTLSGGVNVMEGTDIPDEHVNTRFIGLSYGTNIGKSLLTTVGSDLGFSKIGLSKVGLNGAISYRVPKKNITVRMNVRYNQYKNPELLPWKDIFGGMLDIAWQFKAKISEKNKL